MTDNKIPAGFDAFDEQPNPETLVSKPIKRHAKELQGKAKAHQVLSTDPENNVYTVVSGGSGKRYTVVMFSDNTGHCDCDWGAKRPLQVAENKGAVGCSHVMAVTAYIASGAGRRIGVWSDETTAKKQHKPIVASVDGLVVTTAKPNKPTRKQSNFFSLVDRQDG